MRAEVPPSFIKGYGLQSVCESQELPNSSFKFGEVRGFYSGAGVIKRSTNRCYDSLEAFLRRL